MAGAYVPLFSRGDIEIDFGSYHGKVVICLTAKACALLEERCNVEYYMDALTGFSSVKEDGSGFKFSAKRARAVFAALLDAAGASPDLADLVPPMDMVVILSRLLSAHMRPVAEDEENPPPAAGTSSTPAA